MADLGRDDEILRQISESLSNHAETTGLDESAFGQAGLPQQTALKAQPAGSDPVAGVVVEEPSTAERKDALDDVVRRIQKMSNSVGGADSDNSSLTPAPAPAHESDKAEAADANTFVPRAPDSFLEARLTETEVEALVLKFLLSRGDATGRSIAEQIALPFRLVDELMVELKRDQLVGHKRSAPMNDYVFQVSDLGRERARRYSEECSYFGTAPVGLADYIASVEAQSLKGQQPTETDLRRAFSDLLIDDGMFRRLGPAVNSGKGMFLFGAAGNGKTSIAERIASAFGKYIWIPRTIGVDGDVIRLFDPINHVVAPTDEDSSIIKETDIDRRWIRIERPTIVVGGELTMDNLEVTMNTATGISEAPVQLKSNCGTLVIDDFGRQRMSTDELLNRWIVPLEKRYDFLNLASGKKIQVPFDQLVIFSTNLEPRDLVDEAFLRRIPYKIEAIDPEEGAFRELFKIMARIVGIEFNAEAVDYVIEKHYKAANRPFRNCQPRDLLLQIKNLCLYENRPAEMTFEAMDFAVENYFSVM